MRTIADKLEAELRALGMSTRATQEKRYLKSELVHLGVTVPATRKVALAACRARPEWEHDQVVELARSLWHRPIHELRVSAVEVLTFHEEKLVPDDVSVLEAMLREARTWALVDPLAATVTGALVVRFPRQLHPVLDRWAADEDFWLRRSALLALLGPLRRGEGDFPRFARYADAMLEEKEFFIRKAIGWVLRETAKKTRGRVVDWLLPRAGRASGVTVREAVRPLSESQRARVLAAYRGGPRRSTGTRGPAVARSA